MTRLVRLRCPACNTALAWSGAAEERVFACGACATAVDVAHDGLTPYPVLVAPAGEAAAGLYWVLAGEIHVAVFAATQPAKTVFGVLERAKQAVPFTLEVPMAATSIRACHAAALARAGRAFVTRAWTAPSAPPGKDQIARVGRREAERVAHQVVVSLATSADGELHALELSLHVARCSVVRAE